MYQKIKTTFILFILLLAFTDNSFAMGDEDWDDLDTATLDYLSKNAIESYNHQKEKHKGSPTSLFHDEEVEESSYEGSDHNNMSKDFSKLSELNDGKIRDLLDWTELFLLLGNKSGNFGESKRSKINDFLTHNELTLLIENSFAILEKRQKESGHKEPYILCRGQLERCSPKGPGLNITYRDFYQWPQLTDQEIRKCFNSLTVLDVSRDPMITDEDIRQCTNLTSLRLGSMKNITNAGISGLTNLTLLDLSYNTTITNDGIGHLTNLKSLKLFHNHEITDEGLTHLVNLTALNLNQNNKITGKGLVPLTKLTMLNLYINKITHQELTHLTNLTWLVANVEEGQEHAQKTLSHLSNLLIGDFG